MSVKQRPDGRWRARYRDEAGREHAQHFDTKREALDWERDQRAALRRGTWIDPKAGDVLFEDFAESWFAMQSWRGSTMAGKRSALDCHLLPKFGKQPLGRIRASELQAFTKKLSADRSAGTVRNVLKVLGAILNAAVADEVIGRSPLDRVKQPAYEAPRVTIPTAEQIDALVKVCPRRLRVGIALAAGAGLRSGEARGLQLDRVEFLRRRLIVDKQLVVRRGNIGKVFGPPKSTRSTRTVPLADEVLEAISAHVAEFGTGAHGLIMSDEFGRAFTASRWGERWNEVRAAAKVDVKFHDLRHRCASVLLSSGVPIPVAAEILGHTPSMLLKTYAHVLEGDHDRVRDAISNSMRGVL